MDEHLLAKRTESDSEARPDPPAGPGKRRLAARTSSDPDGGVRDVQCAHSQCIPTAFYKAFKIIAEGIRFLEICYSVPFNGKEKNQNQPTANDDRPSSITAGRD